MRPRLRLLFILFGIFAMSRPARAGAPDTLVFHASCAADSGDGPLVPLIAPHFREACDMIAAADRHFREAPTPHEPYETWFGPWDWTDGLVYPPGKLRGNVKTNFALLGNVCKGWKFEIRCVDEKKQCFNATTGDEAANLYFSQSARTEPIPIWVCGSAYRKLASDPWMLDSKAANWGHELSHACRDDTTNDDGPCTQDGVIHDTAEIAPDAVRERARKDPPWAMGNAYPHQYFLADLWGRLHGHGPGCGGDGCAAGGRRDRWRGLAVLWAILLVGVLCTRRSLSMKVKILGSLAGAGLIAALALGNASCARSARAQVIEPGRPAEPPPPISCAIEVPAEVRRGDPVVVRVSVKNEGAVPLRVLTHPNALGGVMLSQFFEVRCNGEIIPYRGFTGTYVRTQPGHYIKVQAGETVHGAIEITEAHALPPGRCEIEYKAGVGDVLPADGPPMRRPGERHRPAAQNCGKAVVEVIEAAAGPDGSTAPPDGGLPAGDM